MGNRKKLLQLIDRFVEEKSGSWNHEDWLFLVNNVKENGIEIQENNLGDLLESERDKYNAKKHGIEIISKSKLINLCRNFVKKNPEYSHQEWVDFLNDIGKHGYYNKNEVVSILETEKKKLGRKSEPNLEKTKSKSAKKPAKAKTQTLVKQENVDSLRV